MKPTIKANIGGYAFTLEEDAYQRLDNYLSLLKNHFSNNPECNEIIADIESRMSELLQIRLNGEKLAVSVKDAQEIINIMGNPKDFGDNEENNWEGNNSDNAYQYETKETSSSDIKKRLYRDPAMSVIGGVFGGLGHYLRIDPVVLRVIYIALFIISMSIEPRVGSFLIILYVIVWIITPKADTFYQKLSMTGTNPSIQNIESRNTAYSNQYRGSGLRRFLRIIAGIICAIIAFVAFLSIISIVGGAIWLHLDSGSISPSDYLTIFGLNTLNFKISLALILLLPFIGVFYLAMKGLLWSRFTMRDLVISIVCIFILIGSGLYMGNFSYNYAKMLEHNGWAIENIPIQTSSDTIYLKLDDKYLDARPAPYLHHDQINFLKENNNKYLFVTPYILLRQDSTINSLKIEVKKTANEETQYLAQKKAENAKLNYELKDSCVTFSPQLYSKENLWNSEWFEIHIHCPVDKTVIIESPL